MIIQGVPENVPIKQNHNQNWVLWGKILPLTWLWGAGSCLVLVRNDQNNNSQIGARPSLVEGGAATGDWAGAGTLGPAEFWLFFFYTLYNVVVQSSTNPFICVLISTAIFCDTVYFVWIEFRRSILNFPLFLSKFWLLLLTLKQSCIHLIFFSLFKLFLISRPVTFHEEWKHFEISCFSLFRNQWHLWSLCPVCIIVVWKF